MRKRKCQITFLTQTSWMSFSEMEKKTKKHTDEKNIKKNKKTTVIDCKNTYKMKFDCVEYDDHTTQQCVFFTIRSRVLFFLFQSHTPF